mgnify:FL=1
MSIASQNATIKILMADYASNDSSGKMNILGEGINILSYPVQGAPVTSRFSVIFIFAVPGEYCPIEMTIEYSLRDSNDNIVEIPGATGPQPLRVANVITLDTGSTNLDLGTKKFLTSQYHTVIDFGTGIPLASGQYKWTAMIDGDDERSVDYRFCIPDAPAPPVLG